MTHGGKIDRRHVAPVIFETVEVSMLSWHEKGAKQKLKRQAYVIRGVMRQPLFGVTIKIFCLSWSFHHAMCFSSAATLALRVLPIGFLFR